MPFRTATVRERTGAATVRERTLTSSLPLSMNGSQRRAGWGCPVGLCYPGSTMSKANPVSKPRKTPARAGRTEKISVSLDSSDLRALRRRAKKLCGGNLSAAIAEGARRIREEEGREALVAWLGDAGEATPEEREAIRAEWRVEAPKRRRSRAA